MRVLIVDDCEVTRNIVHRTLRQLGYTAHQYVEAADGPTALALLRKQQFGLVLCDWNMPGMDGIDVLRTMRAQGDMTKFGFVTCEGTDAWRYKAILAGAMFVIVKPFTPSDFERVLGDYLGSTT